MIRWFVLFALALGLTVPAQAQQRVADIGIEVRIEPPGVTPPGTEGIVSITITNDGPDIGAGVFRWNQTGDVTGLSYPPLEFLGRIVGPCTISSFGQPPIGDNFGLHQVRDIPPGETRVCTYGFRVLETTKLKQIARWSVFARDGLNLLDDPNDTNNADEILLTFSGLADIRPVPVLSWFGLFTLVLLLGLASIRRMP